MTDSETFDTLDHAIRQRVAEHNLGDISRTLGLNQQVILDLIDEPSDWSFVIKLAVIVEAALTQAIASRLDTTELQQHLNRLSVGGRTGKIQLASDLGMLGPKSVARLKSIASLRNIFAHDVSVIGLSLGVYFESLPKQENLRFLAVLLGIDGKEQSSSTAVISAETARHIVWVASVLSLLDLSHAYKSNANAQRWRDARLLIGDAFLSQRSGDHHKYKDKLNEALAILQEMYGSEKLPSNEPNPPLKTDPV
jgi:hypothetical protein